MHLIHFYYSCLRMDVHEKDDWIKSYGGIILIHDPDARWLYWEPSAQACKLLLADFSLYNCA